MCALYSEGVELPGDMSGVMETKYDIIVDFFLNNWFVAIVVLICVILMAISPVREGLKTLCEILREVIQRWIKNDIYKYKKNGETVVMTRILKSKKLDVVRIDTTSHDLGIQSEYAWLKAYYPQFQHPMQYLSIIPTEQGEKVFDHFPITRKNISKEIYFDISSFFEEPLEILMDDDEYISHKIKKIYRKKE